MPEASSEKKKRPLLNLHNMIFFGMAVGLVVGLLMNAYGDKGSYAFQTTIWWLDLLGREIFIGGLKMIIAPLIFASIVAGISSLPSSAELGNIGFKTLAYYVCTTTIAVAIGIAAVLIIQPGEKDASQRVRAERAEQIDQYRQEFEQETGLDAATDQGGMRFQMYVAEKEGSGLEASEVRENWQRIKGAEERTAGDLFLQDILRPILTNPFNALSESTPNALGVIFFAILVGIACIILGGTAEPVINFFQGFNDVMMTITLWLMYLAPPAIACLIASLVATLGLDSLESLAWYCGTVIIGIAIHVCVLLAIARFLGGMKVKDMVNGIRDAWLIAFSTTSSAATLPVTIRCTTKNMGVSEKVANFTLPVGATINMDGTALYEGIAVIFLIQMYGGLQDVPIVLTASSTFLIFITAVLASVGAAAVPSAGLVTMAIVASAVGLPLYYIVILFAVDRLLDMFRTSTNILGDATGAVVINNLERARLEQSHTQYHNH